MPTCPSPVRPPARRALRAAIITCTAIVLGVVVASTAVAADVSLPYRNTSGFTGTVYMYGTLNFSTTPNFPSVMTQTPVNTAPVAVKNPVSVRVSGWPRHVGPGDDVLYTIYVRNDGNREEIVEISAYLDDDTGFMSASMDGRKVNDGMIRWQRMRMPARSSRNLTLQVRVKSNTASGDIRLLVQAGQSSDSAVTTVTDGYQGSTYYFQEDSNRYPAGALPYRDRSVGDANELDYGNFWYNQYGGGLPVRQQTYPVDAPSRRHDPYYRDYNGIYYYYDTQGRHYQCDPGHTQCRYY